LQCIDEFEASNSRVVNKLRELKDCSDRYRDASTGDLPPASGRVLCGTQTSVEGVSKACGGDQGPSSEAAWTQSDSADTVDAAINCGRGEVHDAGVGVGTMTEEELKEKHNQV